MKWWNLTIALIGIGAAVLNLGLLYKPEKTRGIVRGVPGYYRMTKNWCINLFREKE